MKIAPSDDGGESGDAMSEVEKLMPVVAGAFRPTHSGKMTADFQNNILLKKDH